MIYYQASMRIEDLKKNVLTVNLRTILGSKEGLKYKFSISLMVTWTDIAPLFYHLSENWPE